MSIKKDIKTTYIDLIRAATDTGCIEWVQADVVMQNDSFSVILGEKPLHQYNAFSNSRGQIVGVFCVAKTTSGDYLTDIMTIDELNAVRSCSKNQQLWDKWKTEFYKKAVIKRAYKTWPISGSAAQRLQSLIDSDNEDYDVATKQNNETKKRSITNERLNAAFGAIAQESYTIKELLSAFDLNDEQAQMLADFKAKWGM